MTWNPSKPDIHRFTHGDCHYLARALQKLTGWPLMSFDADFDPITGTMHAFVEAPDGRLLDIEGIHTPAELLEQWNFAIKCGECLSTWSARDWHTLRKTWHPDTGKPDFGPYTYTRARVMAKRLLEAYYAY